MNKVCRPVTQEVIAYHLGQNLPCESIVHDYYPDALYDSVNRLVYQVARKYAVTIPNQSVDDLAQECWRRIIFKLHLFDPEKAKFTTWCYRVSSGVLCKLYHKERKRADRFVSLPDGFDEERIIPDDVEENVLCANIKEIVIELMEFHPYYEDVLVALFGNPHEDKFTPMRLDFEDASEVTGMSVPKIRRFYKTIVYPHLKEKLGRALKSRQTALY